MPSYLKIVYIENLKCAKFINVHYKKFTEEITLKLLELVCDIHMFRLGTNNCNVIDIFYKTKSQALIEKNLPKIRELPNFDEIFSVNLSMNEFYNASVILFKNLLIFLGHLTLTPLFKLHPHRTDISSFLLVNQHLCIHM